MHYDGGMDTDHVLGMDQTLGDFFHLCSSIASSSLLDERCRWLNIQLAIFRAVDRNRIILHAESSAWCS